jgi:type IV secretory pathway TraG/TraD family ATPase VirD4
MTAGAAAYYAMSIIVALACAGAFAWTRLGGFSHAETHGESRWARRRDLRALLPAAAPRGDGILLGWFGGRLVEAPAEDNALVFGVQRSGKTSTVVVPNLLAWRGAAVATSTKDELVRLTGRHRAAIGPVQVFAPLDADQSWITALGLQPVAWNPLEDTDRPGAAAELADLFTAAGKTTQASHWYLSAANLLTGLFVLEHGRDGDLAAVLSDLNRTPVNGWYPLSAQVDGVAAEILAGFAATPEKEAGSIISTARSSLSLWLDERVAAATSATAPARLDLDALLAQGGTLYLVAPAEEAERCRPLFSALLASLLRRATAKARIQGGVLQPRLLLALDEVANFARIPRLASYVSTGPGQGIRRCSASTTWPRWSRGTAGSRPAPSGTTVAPVCFYRARGTWGRWSISATRSAMRRACTAPAAGTRPAGAAPARPGPASRSAPRTRSGAARTRCWSTPTPRRRG